MTVEELSEVLKALNANHPQITQTFNFNAPVGQQIAQVDKIEAHFDKDCGMQIANTNAMGIDEKARQTNIKTASHDSNFEDVIPEHLRTGRLLVAWKQLAEAGILTHDYKLPAGTSKLAAKFLVECFCQEKEKKWASFEKFWGVSNLRTLKGNFSSDQEIIISKIFRNL